MARLFPLVVALVLTAIAIQPAMAKTYRDRDVAMEADADLDVGEYLGLWYEIARFPNRFEKGCQGVTAEYALRPDGKITVKNTCRKDDPNGPTKTASGVARVEAAGQLSVSFLSWLPFARGDYWVLHVDPDYSMAVVGAPAGSTGWILARTPTIDQEQRARAEAVLQRNGYDVRQLMDVQHGQ